MGSFHLVLLLPIFFSLLVHCSSSPIIQAAMHKGPNAYYNCTKNSTFATNSAYRSNVKTLLDWLSSNGNSNARFYNTTVASKNTADTVYGLFYCTRDIDPKSCQVCVIEAAKLILSLCTMAKEAIMWYKICCIRYSDRRIFSTMDESPKLTFMNDHDYVGEVGRFNNILWDMLIDLRTGAANASAKYADRSVNITDNQKIYGSAWCLPYLSTENCSWCLSDAIAEVRDSCCRGKAGGSILYPSCGVRYELYPFHKAHDTAALTAAPPLPTRPPPLAPPGRGKQKTLTIVVIVVPIVVSLVLLALGCCCFLGLNVTRSLKELPEEFFISMKILASK